MKLLPEIVVGALVIEVCVVYIPGSVERLKLEKGVVRVCFSVPIVISRAETDCLEVCDVFGVTVVICELRSLSVLCTCTFIDDCLYSVVCLDSVIDVLIPVVVVVVERLGVGVNDPVKQVTSLNTQSLINNGEYHWI